MNDRSDRFTWTDGDFTVTKAEDTSKKLSIEKKQPDEETDEWYINGKNVLTINREDDGWRAQEAVDDAFRQVAKALGIQVKGLED